MQHPPLPCRLSAFRGEKLTSKYKAWCAVRVAGFGLQGRKFQPSRNATRLFCSVLQFGPPSSHGQEPGRLALIGMVAIYFQGRGFPA